MGKFERTRNILYTCLDLVLTQRELLLSPLISLLCTGLVMLSFLPMWNPDALRHLSHAHGASGSGPAELREVLKLFLFYFCNYFLIAFFNTGLTACAVRHMQGEQTDFREGLGVAVALVHRIAGWALIAASVGTLLRVIESETRNPIARLAAGLFGMTFTVASYFVVPMMVVGDKGPIDALVESSRLFTKTWGERFISALGFGVVFFALALPAVLLIFLALGASGAMTLVLLSLAGIWMVFCALVQSALETVFRAALYAYATTGNAPPGFDASELRDAFVPGKKQLL